MISRKWKLAGILLIVSVNARAADSAWVIRPNSVGPAKVGMSLAQLNTTLHESFSLPKDKDDQPCFYADSEKKPDSDKYPDLSFMIEDGRLTRVDISGPSVATAEGIRVGDSIARVKQVYGRLLKSEPNFYDGSANPVLTIRSSDGLYAIRFITDKGKVSVIYAGRWKSVQYVEGCE
jgi:hypothetical protein